MIAWLLLNWKLAAVGAVFATLSIVASTYRIQRDSARASLAVVRGTIIRMDAAGREQAAAAVRTNLEAAAITQRATDALVSQLADARHTGDLVAQRLRVLAAARNGCTLPDVTVTPSGAADAPGAASSEDAAIDADIGYTRACEADSTRLAGWQQWWRDQSGVRP